MSDKFSEPCKLPVEAQAALLKLEAKNVLRGIPSEIFPDMDVAVAMAVRQIHPEKLLQILGGA